MITKVISGGQTGVDRLGLDVARELDIETGGTAPKHFRTEQGNDPSLAKYGLKESEHWGYTHRTEQNVMDSDGTVIFSAYVDSVGTMATIKFCKAHQKPYIVNPNEDEFIAFCEYYKVKTLNVAGNRASKLRAEDIRKYRRVLVNGLMRVQ